MLLRRILALASVLFALALVPVQAASPTISLLHKFDGADGQSPNLPVLGADGAFYGTTYTGGIGADDNGNGYGVVYRVTPGGADKTLFVFKGATTGSMPRGPLLPLPDGTFFGSTSAGGKSGRGVLFQITPKGGFRLKHQFAALDYNGTNVRGAYPTGAMVLGSDGAVYGTTFYGGTGGGGIVFRYSNANGLSVLHDFSGDENYAPQGLTLGPDGALYGVTLVSKLGSSTVYAGSVYRLTLGGVLTTLHTFVPFGGDTNGYAPNFPPTFGPDGALYGTTDRGGSATTNRGTAYRLTLEGAFQKIHDFTANGGHSAIGSLVPGADGALYGATSVGGYYDGGVVFRLSLAGSYTLLYRFMRVSGGTGDAPQGLSPTGVVFGPDGALYGGTYLGGLPGRDVPGGGGGYGAIFRLSLPK